MTTVSTSPTAAAISQQIASDNENQDNGWDAATLVLKDVYALAATAKIASDVINNLNGWAGALQAISDKIDIDLSLIHGGGSWETGSGGDSASAIYTYFTDLTRADAFKADLTSAMSLLNGINSHTGTTLLNLIVVIDNIVDQIKASTDNLPATLNTIPRAGGGSFKHTNDTTLENVDVTITQVQV